MSGSRRILAACATVLLLQQDASAQYRVDAWTTETGLPQNSVTSIVQTRDGYLWLGTNGGLVRFDGVAFTLIEASETAGLQSVRIHSLVEDRAGAIWIGTEHGGLTRYSAGTFTTYTTSDGLPSNGVSYIHEDRNGTLWLATVNGLVRHDAGRFTTFTTRDGLPDDAISRIADDRDGNLWIGTSRGLVRFAAGRFTTLSTADGLPDNEVLSLLAARDGSVWVGTRTGGLAHLQSGHVTTFTTHDGLPDNEVLELLQDRSGAIWAGTKGGLARADATRFGDAVRTKREDEDVFESFTAGDGLSDVVIRSLLEDREGNLWVGTNTGGLNRLKLRQVMAFGRDAGLPGDGVVPITEDTDGNIWIGMTCGGLVRYADDRFTTYGLEDGLPNDCIWSLLPDRDGGLWIGTWGGGLIHRRADGHLTIYDETTSGLVSNAVLALHEDREGALWIGTGSGLNRLMDGAWSVYRRSDGLAADDVRFITEDREGALWIGTTGGASRFEDGRFTNYRRAEGLSADFVRAIHQTDDGAIWLGTYGGGLNRLKDGHITPITTRHGLFENIVSRIIEDDLGYLWLTGNNGIQRVRRADLEALAEGRTTTIASVAYGVGDGMISSECNGGGQPAGWKARDGRLWFPTARGVAIVDPERIQLSEVVPPVAIEQVLVNGRAREPGAEVEVPSGPGAIEIRYTGLSFSSPEYVRFRYRLDGLDEAWTAAGTRRTAYYSYLPPGRYTFSVTAANRDGVWNTDGVATLPLRVLPPFYRTWWFIALAMAALAGLLVVTHERRVRGLERARAAQEHFSRQLIESQERERQRIAADLHDSLSQTLAVIKNRALIALRTPEDVGRASEQLDEIAEAATDAIDEVREISYNLRPYHLDRLGLTRAIDAMLDRMSGVNDLQIAREIDPLDGVFPKDAEINVYRIVQEGLGNIVKHAGASEARVRILRSAREVTLTISDNGRGFVPDLGRSSGFGLTGMAGRARWLGGSLDIDSQPGRGTTLRITIGIAEDHGHHDPNPDRR